MKIIVTGGGTGGHVYPAVSIAEKIKQERPEAEILFIGTQKGLESDVVVQLGYDFKAIEVEGFRRKLSKGTFKSVYLMFKGFFQAGRLIKAFKPDIIVGTGGYVAGPVMLQGALRNIKTLIHEQNAIPGVTIKLLSPFVDRVCVSYAESFEYFKRKEKLVLTGNPIRDTFKHLDRKTCRNKLNLTHPTLLSVGGSGGAKAINDGVFELIEAYNNKEMHLIHITGKSYYEAFMSQLKEKNIVLGSNIKVYNYVYNMPEYMVASDMILSRAGALTLAEIAIVGLPSILMPSPHVAHDHQSYNAMVYEKSGAGIMLKQKDIKENSVLNLVQRHLFEPEHLLKMRCNAKNLAKPQATELIVKEINKCLESDAQLKH